MDTLYYLIFLIINFQLGCITGYSLGAPWQTCLIMFPKHRIPPHVNDCPFVMTANQTEYMPGDIITVTVSSTDQRQFKGIHLRARPVYGDTEQIVGQFVSWPEDKIKTFDCLGGQKNMVTHRNAVPTAEVVLTWKAPNVSVGDVVFVSSFVENFSTFWSDIRLYITSKIKVTIPPSEQISTIFNMVDWSMCGKEKGCFLYPHTCTGYDCYAAVTYRKLDDAIQFEMFGSKHGYVSVSFSDDKKMGDAETVTCTVGVKGVGIDRGYNFPLFNEKQYKEGLTQLEAQYVDGKLFCRFTRPIEMSVYINKGHTAKRIFDFKKDHYLMLAWGDLYPGSDVISIHVELPPITYSKVNFEDVSIVHGSALPLTKQIHGTIMFVAWILLAGIVTVLPRYFRQGILKKTIIGVQAWFQVHRALGVSVWLLTGASFVLIFVNLEGIPEKTTAHNYLGIAVMAACTFQVLFGLLRPGPDSKLRPIFNVGHWIWGKLTHVTAAVTFFYAFKLNIVPEPQRRFGYIVLAVWLGHQVVWEVCFELYDCCQRKKGDKYTLTDETHQDQTKTGMTTLLLLYTVCLMVIEAAALASIFIY